MKVTIVEKLNNIKNQTGISDIDNKRKNQLILIIDFLKNTVTSNHIKIVLDKKQILSIVNEFEDPSNEILIDVFYYLCGLKWHVLNPIYTYIESDFKPLIITEEQLSEIREIGLINLQKNNHIIESKFKPECLFISFEFINDVTN